MLSVSNVAVPVLSGSAEQEARLGSACSGDAAGAVVLQGRSGSKGKGAQSQINARISAELKREGDEALKAAGLTPTQAVRMLWSLAARHRDDPEKLLQVLDPSSAESSAEELAKRQRKVAAARKGAGLLSGFLKEVGVRTGSDPRLSRLTSREYTDLLREERFEEKGYLR